MKLAVLDRATFALAFAACFTLLLAAHATSLADPPYWDALMGAFAQGHWQATHGFSPFALIRDAAVFNDGGACVYPFSVYPVVVGLLERAGVSTTASFVLLHVVSLVAGAVSAAATFLLARRVVGGVVAALVTLALLSHPTFRALTSQMNQDILLTACTVLAWRATSAGRLRETCLWAACALWIKPTGVLVVVANLASLLLRLARPAWFAGASAPRATLVRALLVHAGLFALFVFELVVVAEADKSPPGVSLFGGTLPFLGKRLWTLPEFGLALFALFAVAPWIVRRARRGGAHPLEIDGLVFVLAFTGFYCQYQNVLPRYFVQALPFVLVLLTAAARASRLQRVVVPALGFVVVFDLANAYGRFHPAKRADWIQAGEASARVSNDGWLLERSLEYRDDLEIGRQIAARCEVERDATVIAGWPILQLLAVPRLGYLSNPPRLAAAEMPIDYAATPIHVASRLRPEPAFVRIVSPNVYAGEGSRVWPGDEILATFAAGRLRAFLVRRPPDPDAGRR